MPLRNIFKVSPRPSVSGPPTLALSPASLPRPCPLLPPPAPHLAHLDSALHWARPHPGPIPFQNCTYYWGFAAWMAYYINHPLYTPPSKWLWDPASVSPHPPARLPSQASPLSFQLMELSRLNWLLPSLW